MRLENFTNTWVSTIIVISQKVINIHSFHQLNRALLPELMKVCPKHGGNNKTKFKAQYVFT